MSDFFFYLILNQICASVVIDKFYGDFADNGWCVRNACVLIVSLNSWVIFILKENPVCYDCYISWKGASIMLDW